MAIINLKKALFGKRAEKVEPKPEEQKTPAGKAAKGKIPLSKFKEVNPKTLISVPTILCPECKQPMKITGKKDVEKTSKLLTRKTTKKVPHLRYECADCKNEFNLDLQRRGGGCFIATAAYGTSTAHEINVLRSFRDNFLMRENAGRKFISLYYGVSPPVAKMIEKSPTLKFATRTALAPIIKAAQKALDF